MRTFPPIKPPTRLVDPCVLDRMARLRRPQNHGLVLACGQHVVTRLRPGSAHLLLTS
jgi:hypothetical protein